METTLLFGLSGAEESSVLPLFPSLILFYGKGMRMVPYLKQSTST
ncbi:unnamed protein product [Brassica rapa subsp. trilocularis]|uniref:(rape) hypothetical protein n=1 Tax=Brassica napus TaxID=3708 RepID=A0A817AC62_BRANA|nr:unnamed protein product [Brassica napus]